MIALRMMFFFVFLWEEKYLPVLMVLELEPKPHIPQVALERSRTVLCIAPGEIPAIALIPDTVCHGVHFRPLFLSASNGTVTRYAWCKLKPLEELKKARLKGRIFKTK